MKSVARIQTSQSSPNSAAPREMVSIAALVARRRA